MSEDRPRPQYGEYATPEQQANAAGLPEPLPAPDATARVNVPPPTPQLGSPLPSRPVRGATRGHLFDRFTTVFFLGVGLFSLINSFPTFLGFSAALDQIDSQIGLGTFPLVALADKTGIGLLVAQIVIYLLTAVLAVRTISRGKRGFYIPIVGFVVFVVVYSVTLSVLFHSDPTFWASVTSHFGGTG